MEKNFPPNHDAWRTPIKFKHAWLPAYHPSTWWDRQEMALASWLVMLTGTGEKARDSALMNKVDSNPRSHVMSVSGLHTLTFHVCSHTCKHIYGGGGWNKRKNKQSQKINSNWHSTFYNFVWKYPKISGKAEEDAYSCSPASRSSGWCLTWLPGIQLIMPSLLTSTPGSIDKVTVV